MSRHWHNPNQQSPDLREELEVAKSNLTPLASLVPSPTSVINLGLIVPTVRSGCTLGCGRYPRIRHPLQAQFFHFKRRNQTYLLSDVFQHEKREDSMNWGGVIVKPLREPAALAL